MHCWVRILYYQVLTFVMLGKDLVLPGAHFVLLGKDLVSPGIHFVILGKNLVLPGIQPR